MKLKWFVVATLVGLLAASGCKKDNKSAPAGGSAAAGSAAAGSAAAGSGMAGSDMAGHDMSGGNMAGSSMAGSGGAGGTAASLTDAEIEGMIKELLVLMTDMSKAVEGKDCAAAAAGITGVLDSHKAFIDKMNVIGNDKAIEDRAEKIMESGGYEKKIDEASAGLGPVAEKCESDPAFKAAMEALDKAIK